MNKKDNHLENIIVKHLAGSHAYGTNIETSDVDYRGIFIADKKYIITPFYTVGEVSDKTEEDTKFYELNKYLELYLDANPNILETLWVDESDIVYKTEMYDILRSHRHELLSKKIAFTYTGYAHNQVTRMKNHHTWMDKERTAEKRLTEIFNNFPCEQVIQWMYDYFPHYVVDRIDTSKGKGVVYTKGKLDFDKYLRDTSLQTISTVPLAQHHFVRLVHNYLPEKVLDRDFNLANFNYNHELIHYGDNIFAVVPKENSRLLVGLGNLLWDSKKERTSEELKVLPSLIVKFNKKEFEEINDNRKNYHTWKENRNSSRAVLESENGYDTKHAMHVVRLLRTAEEALSTGIINVKRSDAQELLAIRNGSWSYNEMMQYFAEKENHIRNVLYPNSTLPKSGDIKKAAKIIINMREAYWYNK